MIIVKCIEHCSLIVVAICLFFSDNHFDFRLWLYEHLGDHIAAQYFAWVVLPVFLVLFSTGVVHMLAPQAIGSGIPEMKTILR